MPCSWSIRRLNALRLELMGHSGDLTGVDQAWADLQVIMGKLNLELRALAGRESDVKVRPNHLPG